MFARIDYQKRNTWEARNVLLSLFMQSVYTYVHNHSIKPRCCYFCSFIMNFAVTGSIFSDDLPSLLLVLNCRIAAVDSLPILRDSVVANSDPWGSRRCWELCCKLHCCS